MSDEAKTYSNPRMSAVIEDWPYGSLRTTATFKIETVPGRGQRGVRTTIDPKTGRTSAPKMLTYTRQARIVDGSDGRTYIAEYSIYEFVTIMRSNMKLQEETIHKADPRYSETMNLFAEIV